MRETSRLQVIFLLLVEFFGMGFARVAWGQSTASLSGTVTDASGALVVGAKVQVHGVATGLDRETTSDAAGDYAVPSLVPGIYDVRVTAAGFAPFTATRVELQVDRRATANVRLSLPSVGSTVEVFGNVAPDTDRESMTVGQVIGRRTVQELPLNGRHFLDLTVLTPGGVTAPQNGNLTLPSRGVGAISYITAGNREDTANFQINGINLNDLWENQILVQPSINTTSEFKINNSTYSAEYGRNSGSIVNVSTRSGTNAFHGEVFDYLRNNSFDTRNYFNRKGTAQNALKRNNFGASLGGPLLRDKTFFFASYEGLRQHQGLLLNSGVLTAAQRSSVTNPAILALLPFIPLPNVATDPTGTRYSGVQSGPIVLDQYTGDILHKLGAADLLHGFYVFHRDVRVEPSIQQNTIPGFGDNRRSHRQILTLNESHVFSPRLVNEARLGFNRIAISFIPAALLNPLDYHIGDGVSSPIGLPQILVADIGLNFGGPANEGYGRTDTTIVVSDALTLLRGRHTIKLGGEARRFQNNNFQADSGSVTFNSVAGFQAGNANSFSITPTHVVSRVFSSALNGFVQDNFKLRPNFTAELGFRFEWNGTPTEGANRLVVFDPATSQLVRTGTQGLGSVYKQNFDYEPRLGFAWDVRGTGRTVLRAGYGLMADQPATNAVTPLSTNQPFANPVSYSNSTVTIPIQSLYASAAASGIKVSTISRNFRNSYTQSFNLNLQQEWGGGLMTQLGYFGSVGRHLRVLVNANQPDAAGVRPFPLISVNSAIAVSNTNFTRVDSLGSSNYNALWATAKKRLTHGLEFNATYMWQKSMDLNSIGSQGGYVLEDSTNPRLNYGQSDFDTRNRISANAIYDVPAFLRRAGAQTFSGFRLSGIAQYQTGNPVNITNTSTFTGVAGVIRPSLIGPVVRAKTRISPVIVGYLQGGVCTTVTPTPGCVFQNAAVAGPSGPILTGFGNMQRNSVTGPGFADVDFSLEKNTRLTERLTVQLRVDAFDAFNHPSFGQPNGNDLSAQFGQITNTRFGVADLGSSRQLQMVARLLF